MDKRDVRLQMRAAMRLAPDISDETVHSFWRRVETSAVFRSSSVVLCYMSISGEVPTAEAVRRWSEDRIVALPLVCGDVIELRRYDPDRLVPGYRGIYEPSRDAEAVSPEEVGLALVPGVAFCRRGGKVLRLGRGGGFYDRLLPALTCPKVGVCFDYRVLDDIPSDPWDAPLDDLAVCSI